jgi:hypothetical protein
MFFQIEDEFHAAKMVGRCCSQRAVLPLATGDSNLLRVCEKG